MHNLFLGIVLVGVQVLVFCVSITPVFAGRNLRRYYARLRSCRENLIDEISRGREDRLFHGARSWTNVFNFCFRKFFVFLCRDVLSERRLFLELGVPREVPLILCFFLWLRVERRVPRLVVGRVVLLSVIVCKGGLLLCRILWQWERVFNFAD